MITVEQVLSPDADVRALVAELDAELRAPGHDPSQHHGYPVEKIFQPGLAFFVARIGGTAAGCGGVQFYPDFAELKRMYARPAARGQGVATALLARLEGAARAQGLRLMRLETGDWIVRAIAFYGREGYRRCEAFPPYSRMTPFSIAHSVFLEKSLP
jgi:putative acetyltransferase